MPPPHNESLTQEEFAAQMEARIERLRAEGKLPPLEKVQEALQRAVSNPSSPDSTGSRPKT